MALPSHVRQRHAAAPTRDDVLAFVEVADTGGHWYWMGDIATHGIDPWPVLKNQEGTWLVMRVLMVAEPGVHHVNTCGLRTCVNPEHWRLEAKAQDTIVTNFDGTGWRPIR